MTLYSSLDTQRNGLTVVCDMSDASWWSYDFVMLKGVLELLVVWNANAHLHPMLISAERVSVPSQEGICLQRAVVGSGKLDVTLPMSASRSYCLSGRHRLFQHVHSPQADGASAAARLIRGRPGFVDSPEVSWRNDRLHNRHSQGDTFSHFLLSCLNRTGNDESSCRQLHFRA